MTGFPINPPRTNLVDRTGYITPEWYRFFVSVQRLIGSGVSSPFDDNQLLAASLPLQSKDAVDPEEGFLLGPPSPPVTNDEILSALLSPPTQPYLLDSSYLNVSNVTSSTTLTAYEDVLLVDASGGAVTVALPAAATCPGKLFRVKKIDASGNAVTIDGSGSEAIDDSTTQVISVQYVAVTIASDGTEWWIL